MWKPQASKEAPLFLGTQRSSQRRRCYEPPALLRIGDYTAEWIGSVNTGAFSRTFGRTYLGRVVTLSKPATSFSAFRSSNNLGNLLLARRTTSIGVSDRLL